MAPSTKIPGSVQEALSPSATAQLAMSGLALIAVAYGLARFAYGLFVPAFRAEFGLDPSAVGMIGSASYAAYCVAIYPAMMLTPRFGSRRLAVAAGVLAALGTGLVGLAPNAATLTAGVILGGLSTGIASPPLAHAVAMRVSRQRRDRVQAIINAGTGLGVALSGPVALLTLAHWRSAWIAFAVVAVAVTLWAARSVPWTVETAHYTEAVRGFGGHRRRLRSLLPEPLLPEGALRLHATALLMGAATAAMWVFGQDVLTDVGGQTEVAAIWAWAALGACGLFGAGAGDLAHRIGLRPAWAACTLMIAAATALIGLLPEELFVSFIASAVFGAAYIATTGLILISAAATYHHQPAAGVGLSFLILALGQSIGGSALGSLLSWTGAGLTFALAAAAAVVSAALPPSRLVSTRTEELTALTVERDR